MKNTRRVVAIVLIIAMVYSVIGSILNKSYAYIVKSDKATQYQFNPQDVLDWAAYVGAGELTTTEFPFITVKPTASDFEGDIENKVWPNYVALTIEDDSFDNSINASDAANLLGCASSHRDSFKIVEQLSNDLGIAANEISLQIRVELRDDNKTVIWDIKNGECKQSDEEIKAGIDEMYNYCKKCYTTKNYQSYTQKIMYGTEDNWGNNEKPIIDEYMEQGESKEEAEEDAKPEMINRYFFGVVEVDATLPDGTVYCLVLGGEGEHKMNWLLAKKDLFIPEPTPEPEPDPEPDPEPTPETKPEPEKKDNTVANQNLAKTGESFVIVSAIAVIAITATALYFKNKKYNKIK